MIIGFKTKLPGLFAKGVLVNLVVGSLALAFLVLIRTGTAYASPAEVANPGLVLTVEGTVEVNKAGQTQWNAASTNTTLGFGDSLRTAPQSRATIRLSDLSVVRVNEKTVLEFRPQANNSNALLNLQTGSTYFFNRSKPSSLQFRTPLISGAIRGTEFNLAAEDSGPTTVTLVEGEVALSNAKGELTLTSGEQGTVDPGQAPRKTAMLSAINIIQWSLYYPAVIDSDELGLSAAEQSAQADSLTAYRAGDLLGALNNFRTGKWESDASRLQYAALLLSVGQVEQTQSALKSVSSASPFTQALETLIAAVKHESITNRAIPTTGSGWLAESYYLQSRSQLDAALKAANEAVKKSPHFGFAWVRLAELEFSLGHIDASKVALEKGLAFSPRNAQALTLKGYILLAQNRTGQSEVFFDQAIALDGALANAWLGRGLCKIRKGEAEAGRQDIQVAATLEPNRSELRSYLAKAWALRDDTKHAQKELRLAKQLDPADPTPWLYSAMLNYDYNRNNEAINDLEKSKSLNENRSVFRSKLLLDQDQSVRGANLAQIYRDVGMTDVSVRESAQAVDNDYGNYSAHLFLANSYDAFRDPKHVNLRYETPWLSQLLVADLLAPVGAISLSQNISQQEQMRLFDGNQWGVFDDTQYSSRGDWIENASQYATIGNTSFAFDEYYRTENGFRPNNDLQEFNFTAKFKQQLTEQDSVFLQADTDNFHSGDVRQYYSQNMASPGFRATETQTPNIYLGYHREWSPGIHTLALAGRLQDNLILTDPNSPSVLFTGFNNTIVNPLPQFPFALTSDLVAYSAELQQIFQSDRQTLVVGGRYQTGQLDNNSALLDTHQLIFPGLTPTPFNESVNQTLNRETVYGYYSYHIVEPLLLTAGLSYDRLEYPANDELPPISSAQQTKEKLSPKAGFRWTPLEHSVFRGAWTRSLGGVFYDSSVRLEPTEIAGFNQAFRSIIPESVTGLVPGSRFETFDLAFDQEFPTRTYLSVVGELLKSSGSRGVGYLNNTFPGVTAPAQFNERLDYRDTSLTVTMNQLLDDEFALGASYKISAAHLDDGIGTFPPAVGSTLSGSANRSVDATLQQINFYAVYNSSCGFFSKVEAIWYIQSNRGYAVDIPGDNFVQVNALAGYRLPRRRAEFQVGLLNIGGGDYRLNPLNLYTELPRERTFVAEVKFNF